MRRSHSATQLTIDVDIIGIQVIGNAYFRSNTLPAFIDGGRSNMRVFINESGREVFARSINYSCVGVALGFDVKP